MMTMLPCLMAGLLTMDLPCEEPPLLLRLPLGCGRKNCATVLEVYHPQPGDIILFSTYHPINDFLYFLAHSGGATHCGIVVERPNGSLGLLEAPGPSYTVMLSDISSRLRFYHGRIWVRRLCSPLSPEQSACLTSFACAQEGKPFSISAMLTPLVTHPVRKPRMGCAGPDEINPEGWFCSALTVAAGMVAGRIDPCVARPKATDPEDLKCDRRLDLSPSWEKPLRYERCVPRLECWWSESCCGQRAWWK